jgi:hypothetical protein
MMHPNILHHDEEKNEARHGLFLVHANDVFSEKDPTVEDIA